MKKILIILIFIINYFSFAEKDSIDILSQRVGNLISKEEKEYFGLFPNIENFVSAELYLTSANNHFFDIKTKNESKNIPISESVLSELRNYLSRYEDLINKNRTPGLEVNTILKPDWVKPDVAFRSKVPKLNVKLMDNTNFEYFLVYHNDSCLVLSPTNYINNFWNIRKNLKIVNYNEIDEISDIEYPIIKGKKYIFDMDSKSLDSVCMFKVARNKIAPELREYLEINKVFNMPTDTIVYDFDDHYLLKNSISLMSSLNFTGLDKLTTTNYSYNKLKYSTSEYFGVSYGYRFFKKFNVYAGFCIEILNFTLTYDGSQVLYGNPETNQFLSNIYLLGLDYNIWHSKDNMFKESQYYIDVYAEYQKKSYYFIEFVKSYYDGIYTNLKDQYVIANTKNSYIAGMKIKKSFDKDYLITLAFKYNHIDDMGVFNLGDTTFTRNLPYMHNFGVELNASFLF